MRVLALLMLLILPIAGAPRDVSAQVVTIQQPIVSQQSVATSVSVPDRGGMVLGGISSGQSGRRSFGPLSGSSFGSAFSASTHSTHVWIHDLAELDRQVLSAAPATSARDPRDRAGRAADQLTQRVPAAPSAQRIAVETSPDAERASRGYRLGVAAHERGATGVARLHWQVAAKLGSLEAQRALESLDSSDGESRHIRTP